MSGASQGDVLGINFTLYLCLRGIQSCYLRFIYIQHSNSLNGCRVGRLLRSHCMGQSHRHKHRHRGSAFAVQAKSAVRTVRNAVLWQCCWGHFPCGCSGSTLSALGTRWWGLSGSTMNHFIFTMNFKCSHARHPVGRAAAALWCFEALGTFSSYPATSWL